MNAIAHAVPWIATIFLAVVGFVGALFPVPLSSAYGVPIERGNAALAHVRAAGMRDVVLAIFLALVMLLHDNEFAASFCDFLAALAAFDLAVVAFGIRKRVIDASPEERRRLALSVCAHAGGVVLFLVSALLLLRVP